jgi:hypothetical protein
MFEQGMYSLQGHCKGVGNDIRAHTTSHLMIQNVWNIKLEEVQNFGT